MMIRTLGWAIRQIGPLAIVVVVGAAGLGVGQEWRTGAPIQTAEPPSAPVALVGGASLGRSTALMVMAEYSDFECVYCRRFATDIFPTLKRKYVDTGAMRFVFQHFPIYSIHRTAATAAQAVECAGRQDKFWNLHDRLFARPARLEAGSLEADAFAAGLDLLRYSSCMDEPPPSAIRESANALRRLGIHSAPAFLLGTDVAGAKISARKVIIGARPLKEFEAAIESLKQSTPRP